MKITIIFIVILTIITSAKSRVVGDDHECPKQDINCEWKVDHYKCKLGYIKAQRPNDFCLIHECTPLTFSGLVSDENCEPGVNGQNKCKYGYRKNHRSSMPCLINTEYLVSEGKYCTYFEEENVGTGSSFITCATDINEKKCSGHPYFIYNQNL